MASLLERAVAEAAKLPKQEQDRIGRDLIAHLEKLRQLRSDIERGVRSLDAGEGRELDADDVLRRARMRHGKR